MKNEHVIHPLNPIFDVKSQVLILGSFPSVKSRELCFYYANPHNRFWPVLSAVFKEEIVEREAFCHRHHIALWDVIHACTIHQSSDSSISDVEPNDIRPLLEQSQIHTIFTTGRKASDLYNHYMHYDPEHICLPSTSSANAHMKFNDLVQVYSIIRKRIYEE